MVYVLEFTSTRSISVQDAQPPVLGPPGTSGVISRVRETVKNLMMFDVVFWDPEAKTPLNFSMDPELECCCEHILIHLIMS